MIVPEFLVTLCKPWADFYSHSKVTETVVQFLHIGGLLLAGGIAVSADRGTFRALRLAASDRAHYVEELSTTHRWVLTGLGVIVVSGVALLTADIETFYGSWIYWVKMTLVVSLLINGYLITRAERGLATDASDDSPHWKSLRRAAVRSLSLWFTITLAGVGLVNLT